MRNGNGVTAYIALGSNLGDRARAIYGAIQKLFAHPQVTVTSISELVETAPVGGGRHGRRLI